MAKELEQAAIVTLIRNLDLPSIAVRVLTQKRKNLFNTILKVCGDVAENLDGVTLDERWQSFKQDIPPLPDALLIDAENWIAYFLEIEDTNPLNEARIDQYTEAWWTLDMVEWDLRLVVADRYGRNHHEFDLLNWQDRIMRKLRDA